MIDIIRSDARGGADHGWLKSKHTFSFADYHNPNMMGFAKLRVVNEDWIEPGQGFGTHPHKDMEIVTYMIDGALEHKDSMGNGSVIRPGELQRMTAGTGVFHSEFNHSADEQAHLLQIWILPERNGLEPGYEQKLFPSEEKRNQWRLVGSRDGRDGSLTIHQDVNLWSTELDDGEKIAYEFNGKRRGFMQVVRGSIEVEGETLEAGDALATQDHESFAVRANNSAELLLFDMA
jgi:redox-sensitive bicupin YhaK (pirin superfamily)